MNHSIHIKQTKKEGKTEARWNVSRDIWID